GFGPRPSAAWTRASPPGWPGPAARRATVAPRPRGAPAHSSRSHHSSESARDIPPARSFKRPSAFGDGLRPLRPIGTKSGRRPRPPTRSGPKRGGARDPPPHRGPLIPPPIGFSPTPLPGRRPPGVPLRAAAPPRPPPGGGIGGGSDTPPKDLADADHAGA